MRSHSSSFKWTLPKVKKLLRKGLIPLLPDEDINDVLDQVTTELPLLVDYHKLIVRLLIQRNLPLCASVYEKTYLYS